MNKWKKLFWVLCLIAVSISNIGLMPEEFYALLAMLNLLIGVIIDMTIFLPCGNTDKG